MTDDNDNEIEVGTDVDEEHILKEVEVTITGGRQHVMALMAAVAHGERMIQQVIDNAPPQADDEVVETMRGALEIAHHIRTSYIDAEGGAERLQDMAGVRYSGAIDTLQEDVTIEVEEVDDGGS